MTDRRVLVPGPADEAEAIRQLLVLIGDCADAGVDLVQIREADLTDRRLVALVRDAVDRTRGTRARVVVNDRPDVALAAGADGVHLKDDTRSAARVRILGPSGWIVGRSVHDAAAARRAAAAGAVDYLLAGTLFASASKPGRTPLGAAGLRTMTAAVRLPMLAIGGIGVDEAPRAVAAGAAGVAGIRLFRPDRAAPGRRTMAARVQALRAALDNAPAVV